MQNQRRGPKKANPHALSGGRQTTKTKAERSGISQRRIKKQIVKRQAPRTVEDFHAMSEDARERWNRVAHVIQKVRKEGISVTQAAKDFALDRKEVIELGGRALRKRKNGRYEAKPHDRLIRFLVLPSPDGMKEVAIRDSRTASKIAAYSDAVHKFLQTGDESKLKPFRRLQFKDATGNSVTILTDPKQLTRLGSAGVLSFESLYARVA
ncbi:hypothetical protein [Edaphobacter bradus]|uniref:hypothetical protein n=1 Tax=Edaphobacter bradus TaxID=2259016 RepID=UPI0021DFB113|nr:hypothetical protein [Edaphobacter bradus]